MRVQQLTPAHLEAVSRRRRVVVHFDVIHGEANFTNLKPDELVKTVVYVCGRTGQPH